eukprot:SAG22_NODE_2271_length_2767_cov_2.952547_5_plen_112_part_01
MTLGMSPDYLAVLGDSIPGAWDDGTLTAEEMATDPDALALLTALRQQIADQLGIDVSLVTITALDRSGNIYFPEPAPEPEPLGGVPEPAPAPLPEPGSAVENGMTINVHPDF